MYLPGHFTEERVEPLHELMRKQPFAILISGSGNGIAVTHLPLVLDPAPPPWGTLRGHVARANSHWRELEANGDALAIFLGPQGYISPSWYPAKRAHGKVVPTWNYMAVHAHVRVRVVRDAAWLRRLVEALTERHESGAAEPWSVSDAPPDYIDQMLRGIVGFEMSITQIEGKWKLSQNRSAEDRRGVIEGLRRLGDEQSHALAAAIESASSTPISATVG
jgi:transcriptional regulator